MNSHIMQGKICMMKHLFSFSPISTNCFMNSKKNMVESKYDPWIPIYPQEYKVQYILSYAIHKIHLEFIITPCKKNITPSKNMFLVEETIPIGCKDELKQLKVGILSQTKNQSVCPSEMKPGNTRIPWLVLHPYKHHEYKI